MDRWDLPRNRFSGRGDRLGNLLLFHKQRRRGDYHNFYRDFRLFVGPDCHNFGHHRYHSHSLDDADHLPELSGYLLVDCHPDGDRDADDSEYPDPSDDGGSRHGIRSREWRNRCRHRRGGGCIALPPSEPPKVSLKPQATESN